MCRWLSPDSSSSKICNIPTYPLADDDRLTVFSDMYTPFSFVKVGGGL